MRLVIALVAAAAIGALLGYAASEERARGEAAGERTITITTTAAEPAVPNSAPNSARPNPRAGRRVFARVCSRCHALEPGNWTGNKVNLTALQPDYETAVVKVTRGGIAMPSFSGKLSNKQIRDVAAFVASEAARRGMHER